MTGSRLPAVVWLLLALCTTTFGQDGPARDPPAPERVAASLPFGAYVRADRPLVVRVPGGVRVRTGTGPWALGQGAAGDEFVLLAPELGLGAVTLEIDRGDRIDETTLEVHPLPREGRVVGLLGGGRPAEQEAGVALPADGLPTVPEAWHLFDQVRGPDDALEPAARAALAAWRELPHGDDPARRAFEPALLAPSSQAFQALGEVARSAPHVRPDVGSMLWLVAGLQALLLVFFALRREVWWKRVLFVCVPSLVALTWLLLAGRLPGALRTTVLVIEGPQDRLAVVRFEARRDAEVRFDVPRAAGAPVVLRYDWADASGHDAEVGRGFSFELPAGQKRLVAFRMPPSDRRAAASDEEAGAQLGGELRGWLEALGLQPRGSTPAVDRDVFPTGAGGSTVGAATVRVAAPEK